jgi:hypothetical protein
MEQVSKEAEIMSFLQDRVFGPVLASPRASDRLKQGVRMTVTRMNQRDAAGMIHYFWSAIVGQSAARVSRRRCVARGLIVSKKRSRSFARALINRGS